MNRKHLTQFTKLTQSRLVQPINLTEFVTKWIITSDSYTTIRTKLKQPGDCRLLETFQRERLQPTPKLPPPGKDRVRRPTGRDH